jgi:hypothetical protein
MNAINDKSSSSQFDTNIHDSSGYARGAAQIPQVNTINDKSHPNPTTSIHNSSGYAGGAAQIPWTNDVNDKSCPNSTMNIQNSSGLAKGAAQIQLANTINDRSHSIILLVTPEALPKFHRQPN